MADREPLDARRIGGLCGIGATALLIASMFVVDPPPGMHADAAEIKAFLLDNRTGGNLSVLTAALALPLLLFFLAGLRERLCHPTVDGWLPTVATRCGALFAVGLVLGNTCFYSATWTKETANASADAFRVTWDLGYLVYLAVFPIAAALVAGTGIAALRSRLMPRWWGWLGVVVGIDLLASTVAVVAYTSAPAAFPALVGFLVWVLAGSIVLVRSEAGPPEGDPAVA